MLTIINTEVGRVNPSSGILYPLPLPQVIPYPPQVTWAYWTGMDMGPDIPYPMERTQDQWPGRDLPITSLADSKYGHQWQVALQWTGCARRFYCITLCLFYASKNHEVDLLIGRQSIITASIMSQPFQTAHVWVHVHLINGRQNDTFHSWKYW